MPPNRQAVLDRFTAACQSDERILAAFLGGSYARNAADIFSDLDLYLVTTDEALADFHSQRFAFIRHLGEPVFAEDFDLPNLVFYVLADGTEGELGYAGQGNLEGIHSGPYQVLVDKNGMLAGVVFSDHMPDSVEQTEKLRRQIYWFWHELSHFITAIGRGQLWWAQGQIEALRNCCVNLARLRHNFEDTGVGAEPFFKIEKELPVALLSDLETTYCRMDSKEMVQAAVTLVEYYRAQAVPLAREHSITYPEKLERVMVQRLEQVISTG